jgi:uncharacterized protein (DUF885 family)
MPSAIALTLLSVLSLTLGPTSVPVEREAARPELATTVATARVRAESGGGSKDDDRPDAAAAALGDLIREYEAWRYYEFPELARSRGKATRDDAIAEVGIAAEGRRAGQRRVFLEELNAIDATKLNRRDRLDHAILRTTLEQAIERYERGLWLEAVGPLHGPQVSVGRLAEGMRFEGSADYENYLKRLTWVPQNIANVAEMLREGVVRGIVAPRVVLASVPAQFDACLASGLLPLRDPLLRIPASVPEARRIEMLREFDEKLLPAIRTAVTDLAAVVRSEYLRAAREAIACTAQPNGEAIYRFRLAQATTTALTSDAIHAIGLSEVARIHDELSGAIRRTDWYAADPAHSQLDAATLFVRFRDELRTNPRFYHATPEALLTGYRDICKRIDAHLPRLFGRLPRLTYGVRAVPSFMAPSQTTAYYDAGSIATGEPGWFSANTFALDQRPTYEMVPLSLHEAVPGHHLQIALAEELEGLRDIRRDGDFTAFVEGWGLYAERLGIEMGLYENPYDDCGRLLYEMWRACRLVVDTGMHAKGWSRERAIAYMTEHTALSALNIQNEIDRYISWPGQACAYKIGELKIRELRAFAEKTLGARFRLRAFHDALLGEGPLPLSVLEETMHRWIETERLREDPAN